MIRGELDLELGKFNAKLAEAVNRTARAKQQMAAKSGGGGGGIGEVGNDLASAFGVGPLRALSTWVGGFAAAAVGAKALLSSVDDLADNATRLGETPETLQRVGHAAALSGSSVEGLAGSMLKLEKNLGDVENSGATEALARYGLTAQSLAAMPLDQKILAMADAFQKARADGRGYADLLSLVGKSGGELIPLLSQTREELQGMFNDVNVLSNGAVANMSAINDRLDAFGSRLVNTMKKGINETLLLGDAIGGLMKGKSLDSIFGAQGDADYQAQLKAVKTVADQKSRAAGMARDREAAAAAAAEKATAAQGKAADKGLEGAKQKLASRQMAGMDDPQRLTAMGTELQGIFDSMKEKGGLFFDQTTEGLAKWAAALEKGGHKELAAEVLGMQEEALRLQQEMAKVSSDMRQDAVNIAKDKQERADAARAEEEERRNKLINQMAGRRNNRAAVAGETAGVLGILTGSGSDLVLNESRQQNQTLKSIEAVLRNIETNSKADPFRDGPADGGFGFDLD